MIRGELRVLAMASAMMMAGPPAFASMPMLSALPMPATLNACQVWAGKQDGDAIEMWGTQERGGSSRDLGLSRLTASCMGDKPPEIVGFYSSAGAADAFCAKHPAAGICKDRQGDAKQVCSVDDPTPTPLNFRTGPYGKILGSFQNGTRVEIIDQARDAHAKVWVYVASEDGRPFGWVYRDYIRCE